MHKILDIGCGGGQLLDFLFQKGYKNLTGMDPSPKSIDYIKSQGYCGIVQSVFDQIDKEYINQFGLVISTMVAEHIYDLNKYIEKLRLFVNSGGFIFVTVPAVEGFEHYICSKPNYFNQEHINYFSAYSLQNIFGKYELYAVNDNFINDDEQEKIIYALFKVCEDKREIKKDYISIKSIKNYLIQNEELNNKLNAKIEYLLNSGKRLVFWGSGQYAKQIIAQYPSILNKILYFVDNNTTKHGGHIEDKEIVSPEKIYVEKEDVIVCVCSMKNSNEIKKQLNFENCNKEIIIL